MIESGADSSALRWLFRPGFAAFTLFSADIGPGFHGHGTGAEEIEVGSWYDAVAHTLLCGLLHIADVAFQLRCGVSGIRNSFFF